MNPFKQLARPRLENPQGEEVSGCMSCQETGCHKVATTGRYIAEKELLAWKCEDGHYSYIEGYRLDG